MKKENKKAPTTMADSFAFIHHFFILLSLTILFSSTITTSTEKPNRFITKLIHRDSVYSPHYNPRETISDWAMRAVESSSARFQYLNARTKSSSLPQNNIRGTVTAQDNGAIFLVNVSIGKPPIPQLVAMDTGSNLLWIQCLPCKKCSPRPSPIFDPSKSSTYVKLSCHSPYCQDMVSFDSKCRPVTEDCIFSIEYQGRVSTEGDLGAEQLTLLTPDEGTTNTPDVVFGCGSNNNMGNGQYSGILGLGSASTSLASQLGSQFSYCIGDITNRHYSYNQLIFGDGAKIEGNSTPIDLYDGIYYLKLLGISVGQKRLNILPNLFRRDINGNGGVVIDSGSTLNYLQAEGYVALKAEVENVIAGMLHRITAQDDDMLCYDGVVRRDLKGFPVVTFHFAGDTDLVLDTTSMFWQLHAEMFCMATTVSKTGLNLIGVLAQQNYNVAYNLEAKEVSFQMIDCQLLED